jgi:anti-sigma factor RsiW
MRTDERMMHLLSRYLDGELVAGETQELEERLLESASDRSMFWAYTLQHGMTQEAAKHKWLEQADTVEAEPAPEPGRSRSNDSAPEGSRWGWPWSWGWGGIGALAAVVAMAAAGWIFIGVNRDVARLAKAVDVIWIDATRRLPALPSRGPPPRSAG